MSDLDRFDRLLRPPLVAQVGGVEGRAGGERPEPRPKPAVRRELAPASLDARVWAPLRPRREPELDPPHVPHARAEKPTPVLEEGLRSMAPEVERADEAGEDSLLEPRRRPRAELDVAGDAPADVERVDVPQQLGSPVLAEPLREPRTRPSASTFAPAPAPAPQPDLVQTPAVVHVREVLVPTIEAARAGDDLRADGESTTPVDAPPRDSHEPSLARAATPSTSTSPITPVTSSRRTTPPRASTTSRADSVGSEERGLMPSSPPASSPAPAETPPHPGPTRPTLQSRPTSSPTAAPHQHDRAAPAREATAQRARDASPTLARPQAPTPRLARMVEPVVASTTTHERPQLLPPALAPTPLRRGPPTPARPLAAPSRSSPVAPRSPAQPRPTSARERSGPKLVHAVGPRAASTPTHERPQLLPLALTPARPRREPPRPARPLAAPSRSGPAAPAQPRPTLARAPSRPAPPARSPDPGHRAQRARVSVSIGRIEIRARTPEPEVLERVPALPHSMDLDGAR